MSEREIEAWWARLDGEVQSRLLLEADVLDVGLDAELLDAVVKAGPVVAAVAWLGTVKPDDARPHVSVDEPTWQIDDDVLEWVQDRARAEFSE